MSGIGGDLWQPRVVQEVASLLRGNASDEEGGKIVLDEVQAEAAARHVLAALAAQEEYPQQTRLFGIRFLLEPDPLRERPGVIHADVWVDREWLPIGEVVL